ncbi:unnamed protein product [Ilex paraguariensis]|uniref:Uncharacterized protein n=1 Tax=Ilex paraguariensis TaxID=185542 RepID=A0ABC8RP58_9AQUA
MTWRQLQTSSEFPSSCTTLLSSSSSSPPPPPPTSSWEEEAERYTKGVSRNHGGSRGGATEVHHPSDLHQPPTLHAVVEGS